MSGNDGGGWGSQSREAVPRFEVGNRVLVGGQQGGVGGARN